MLTRSPTGSLRLARPAAVPRSAETLIARGPRYPGSYWHNTQTQWLPQDLADLRTLADARVPLKQAGDILGRRPETLAWKIRELRQPQPPEWARAISKPRPATGKPRGGSKPIDLTGRRFGKLLVLNAIANPGQPILWHCQCDCGNTTTVRSDKLRYGRTRSCGCYRKEYMKTVATNQPRDAAGQRFVAAATPKKVPTAIPLGRRSFDFTNRRFGKLVARYPVGVSAARRSTLWFCECDCGNTTTVNGGALNSGNTKSCGCLRAIKSSERWHQRREIASTTAPVPPPIVHAEKPARRPPGVLFEADSRAEYR